MGYEEKQFKTTNDRQELKIMRWDNAKSQFQFTLQEYGEKRTKFSSFVIKSPKVVKELIEFLQHKKIQGKKK